MADAFDLEQAKESSLLLQAQREAAWAWIKQGIEQRRRNRPMLTRAVLVRKSAVSRARRSGFTLLEVMVATAILAFGAVMLTRSFFVNTDAAAEAGQRLRAGAWLGEEMTDSVREWERSDRSFTSPNEGTVRMGERSFFWKRAGRPVSGNIDRIDLVISWKAGARLRSLALTTFVGPL